MMLWICLVMGLLAADLASAQRPKKETKPAAKQPASRAESLRRPGQKSAFDKQTLADYLRHQFLLPATLEIQVSDPQPSEVAGLQRLEVALIDGSSTRQKADFLVSADGTKIIQGKVYDIRESPFASELRLLSKTEGWARLGPEQAPVTVVVFSDFQCPYCKEQARLLRQNLSGTLGQKVRLYFRDFPLEQIHPWARTAALIGQCIKRAGDAQFWQYHDWVFEHQASLTLENIRQRALEFANQKSMDTLQIGQCLEARLTEAELEKSLADAKALQVQSTPTLFVNGRRLVGNVPWEQLKAIIDYELEYAAKQASAEGCCEVKLALPGVK
ncbi:MAG: DsbA family protein [Bryobacteraceae bacterium]|nr:DsbA family protein [Bryobacteraceae bacterium]MDW8376782.1 DsbA family protein [Bryobacterales bacterium]